MKRLGYKERVCVGGWVGEEGGEGKDKVSVEGGRLWGQPLGYVRTNEDLEIRKWISRDKVTSR